METIAIKTVLLKSWKTTLAGVLIVLLQIGKVIYPNILTPTVADSITALLAAVGLVVSKDGNITGKPAASIEQPEVPSTNKISE